MSTQVPQRLSAGSFWTLVKQSVVTWMDDYAPSMGAALAYYTIFSLAPLLLLVIAVAGLAFGEEAARGHIVSQLGGLVGTKGAEAIQDLLKSTSHTGTSIVATLISIVTLMIGATTVFAELQTDLDRIWRTPAAASSTGVWGLIRTRLLSLGMVASIGFLLLVSLVVSAVLSALGGWWGSSFGGWAYVLQIVNQVTSFGIITVLFALIYRILPRGRVEWHDVWIGASVTALLFTLGKYAVGVYIGQAAVTSGFGAAGSIVVLLVWVYYSSQLFLLGAEFTWVYAHRHGSRAGEAVSEPPVVPSAADRQDVGTGPSVGVTGLTMPAVTKTSGARSAPAGWEFLYAGMVAVAFGVTHWYLRAHPDAAAADAPGAARRVATGEEADGRKEPGSAPM